jgi:hypothetical protein
VQEANTLSALRWLEGEERGQESGCFQGRWLNAEGSNTVIDLNTGWVKYWFEKLFMDAVQAKAAMKRRTDHRWVNVPVGSSRRDRGGLENIPPKEDYVFLEWNTHYLQGKKQTCWFDSIASALYHKGFHDLAEEVHKLGEREDILDFEMQKTALIDVMNQSRLFHGDPKIYMPDKGRQRKHRKRHALDVLELQKEDHPDSGHLFLMQIQGKDGHCRHAVATIDRIIFDSTYGHPMILSKNALDWSCNCEGGFHRVYYALRWRLKSPTTTKKRRKKKKNQEP